MDVDVVQLNYPTGSPGDIITISPPSPHSQNTLSGIQSPCTVNHFDVTYGIHIPVRTEYGMEAVRSKQFDISL